MSFLICPFPCKRTLARKNMYSFDIQRRIKRYTRETKVGMKSREKGISIQMKLMKKKSRFFYLAALDVLLNGCRQGWTRLFCFLLFARAFGSHFNGKRQLFLLFALSLSILRARLVPTPVQLEHIDSNVGW